MIFLWRNICFSKQNIINVQQIYCCISLWLWANDLKTFFSSYIYECVVVWYKQKWEKVIVYFLYPITRQIYRRSSSIMNFHILPSYLFYVLKLLQCIEEREKIIKSTFLFVHRRRRSFSLQWIILNASVHLFFSNSIMMVYLNFFILRKK